MKELREKIKSIDQQIIDLLAQRLDLAKKIGREKSKRNLPTKNFQVEREIFERNNAIGEDLGLFPELTKELTDLLIRFSILTQEQDRQNLIAKNKNEGEHIAIVGGNGQMGQWFCHFFTSQGHRVSIVDLQPSANLACGFSQISLPEACQTADTIVLATPLATTAETLRQIIVEKTSALVFDIASLKSPLIDVFAEGSKQGLRLGSIHPMFGPDVKLLSGKNILLCAFPGSCGESDLQKYFAGTSAQVSTIQLAEHDQVMNLVLGLSHLINLIFADVVHASGIESSLLAKAASATFAATFAVSERVLKENESLYYDIQNLNNHGPKLHLQLEKSLKAMIDSIQGSDRQSFEQRMRHNRDFFAQIMAQL